MPRVKIWGMGCKMSRGRGGREGGNVQGKVGKDIKILSRQEFAVGDDSVGMI